MFENERANEAISVNGLRVSNNNFLLNGVDNNEFGLGGVVVLPPPDAIQEFKTEENSMSAEFGRGGAAVNVVLKSGTNQIHGGLYEFIRNDKLDAVNYFNQGQQPFKRNQFGAFLGGPIRKNKTFIFGDYQGSRLRQSSPFLSTVPTAAERAGDFTDRLTGQTFSPCSNPGPLDPVFDTGTIFDPSTTQDYPCQDSTAQKPDIVSLRTPVSYNGKVNVIDPSLINKVGSNIANFYPTAEPQRAHQQLSRQSKQSERSGFLRHPAGSPLPRAGSDFRLRTVSATCAASNPDPLARCGEDPTVARASAILAPSTWASDTPILSPNGF